MTKGHAAALYGLVPAVLSASEWNMCTDDGGSPGTWEVLSFPERKPGWRYRVTNSRRRRCTRVQIRAFLVRYADVAVNGASATDKPDPVIDDFSHGWRDWYKLSPDNPHHWEFSTRKLTDPKWRGQPGQRLAVEVQADKPNELVIVLTTNFFRSYRGKSQEFVAVVKLGGGKDTQTVMLEPKDFMSSDGETLSSWSNVDLLSFRAYYDKGEKLLGSKNWAGPQPMFKQLWWQANER